MSFGLWGEIAVIQLKAVLTYPFAPLAVLLEATTGSLLLKAQITVLCDKLDDKLSLKHQTAPYNHPEILLRVFSWLTILIRY